MLKKRENIPFAENHLIYLDNVQPFQHQVIDNLPQTKHHNFSSKASSSPRIRFNKHIPLSPENSMQWIPFIPKEGGLLQVDIGGHPPIPTGSNQLVGNLLFLAFFRVLNLWGHFEGLNDVFHDRAPQ
jgi:hypothetical protein